MKLIVGLGNPGEKYRNTRHNAGWLVLDYLASQQEALRFRMDSKFEAETIKIGDNIFAKPQTFMNDSGRSVRKLVDYYGISLADLVILHDDLDIALGAFKIELAHGPKIHNGVNSVEQSLGSKQFWRVRIGVDNRTADERRLIAGREYVLKQLTKAEDDQLLIVSQNIEQHFTFLS